jgi:hypothetical protein
VEFDRDKNAALDPRHVLPEQITKPQDPNRPFVKILRCFMREGGCNHLLTNFWATNPKYDGSCPFCGCHYVISTRLRGLEWITALWNSLVRHWTFWGRWDKSKPWHQRGWGYSWPPFTDKAVLFLVKVVTAPVFFLVFMPGFLGTVFCRWISRRVREDIPWLFSKLRSKRQEVL